MRWNLLSGDKTLADALRASGVPHVMTPHPLEAARLLGCTVAEIQRDRLGAARRWPPHGRPRLC